MGLWVEVLKNSKSIGASVIMKKTAEQIEREKVDKYAKELDKYLEFNDGEMTIDCKKMIGDSITDTGGRKQSTHVIEHMIKMTIDVLVAVK